MLAAVPGIKDLANIKGEQISNVGSQDMTSDILLTVAKRCNELLAKDAYNGIVITHGIHGAHSLTKTSTTAIQTFMSPLRGIVGVSSYGKNDFYNTPSWKHTSDSEFDITDLTRLPRVDKPYRLWPTSAAILLRMRPL